MLVEVNTQVLGALVDGAELIGAEVTSAHPAHVDEIHAAIAPLVD